MRVVVRVHVRCGLHNQEHAHPDGARPRSSGVSGSALKGAQDLPLGFLELIGRHNTCVPKFRELAKLLYGIGDR